MFTILLFAYLGLSQANSQTTTSDKHPYDDCTFLETLLVDECNKHHPLDVSDPTDQCSNRFKLVLCALRHACHVCTDEAIEGLKVLLSNRTVGCEDFKPEHDPKEFKCNRDYSTWHTPVRQQHWPVIFGGIITTGLIFAVAVILICLILAKRGGPRKTIRSKSIIKTPSQNSVGTISKTPSLAAKTSSSTLLALPSTSASVIRSTSSAKTVKLNGGAAKASSAERSQKSQN